MKKAIVTISCGSFYDQVSAITHPTIERYAQKLDADFIVWSDYQGHTMPQYKKMELGRLLDRYHRVLYLDTDILIRDDAPDIFKVVPEDQLGMLDEGQYYSDRNIWMIRFMEGIRYDARQWDGKYYNAGVIVLSQAHRNLFVQPPVEIDNFREQTYLNILISASKTKVFPLPYRFNRVYCMDTFYGEERFDSYIMHYAGVSSMLSGEALLELIRTDLAAWEKARPDYNFRKHMAFIVQGGLAEHVAAEPAIRYARQTVYAGDEVVVVSDRPGLFAHVEVPVYSSVDQVPQLGKFRRLYTLGDPTKSQGEVPSRDQVHCVNFASLQSLGIELPLASKTPRLVPDPQALASVADHVRPHDLKQLVALHAGRQGEPNAFAADVWQSYADAIVESGHRVAVVGSREEGDWAAVELDRSRCVDLVDRLTTEESIALVSQARVLVANDSAAVAVAGAFENWIGLVAPARHPERVLHWRHGSQLWRAQTLERAPRYDDHWQHRRAARAQPSSDERLPQSLPEPPTVLDFVSRALAGGDDW